MMPKIKRRIRTVKHLRLWMITMTFNLSLSAQTSIGIKHYGLDEGLSQGMISHLYQDNTGYLWLSTWDGLVCFDGYVFKTYKARPGDGNKLNTNRFGELKEDGNGNIWTRDHRQAIMFERKTRKFHNVLQEIGVPNESQYFLKDIYVLKKNVVWLKYENNTCLRLDLSLPFKEGCDFFYTQSDRLQGAIINSIFEDTKGNEWLLTDKGAVVYGENHRAGQISFTIAAEWRGKVYFGSPDGLFGYWSANKLSFEEISSPDLGNITSLTVLDESEIIITSQTYGAFIFNYEKKEVVRLDLPLNTDGSRSVLSAFVDSEGDIWFEPPTVGAIFYSRATNKAMLIGGTSSVPTPDQSINFYQIVEGSNLDIWIYSKDRNLWRYNKKSGKLTSILEILDKEKSNLSVPAVRGFILDKQGILWVNTYLRGLHKLTFPVNTYTFFNDSDMLESRALLVDSKKNLWVASKDKKIRIYSPDDRLVGFLSPSGKIHKKEQDFNLLVYCLFEDSRKRIWIGTRYDGVYLLTPAENKEYSYTVTHYKKEEGNKYSLGENSIYSIMEDRKGRIWIGTYGGGVNIVDNGSGDSLRFIHAMNDLKEYPIDQLPKVRCIEEVSEGTMFIGTTDGLAVASIEKQDIANCKFSIFRRDAKDINSLSSNDVMDIMLTSQTKEIYVATLGGGFDKVSIQTERGRPSLHFEPFSQQNGLISDQSLSLIEDREGVIWIATESALSRYYPWSNLIESFTANNFHQKINFSEAHPVVDSRGLLCFGINEGFIKIDIERIYKSSYIPSIVLTELRIHNEANNGNNMNSIDCITKLVLSPKERNVTIQFAALDFVAPHNIQYAYRLKGLEEEWNLIGNSRSAIYTNLPNGEYIFEVRSTNSDGVWVDNTRSLDIEVPPRFMETVWAWMLICALIVSILIVAVIAYLTIYKLRHDVKMEEHLTQLKLQFFTNVSHELRTPLTLISSPLEEVLSDEKLSLQATWHLRLIQKNVDRLLVLVNQILDFRKIQNSRMRLMVEKSDVIAILKSLMENFMPIADEKQIKFSSSFSDEKVYLWIDKDKFEKIIINLLSNSFKYTERGKEIRIELVSGDTEVLIRIIDEGLGISEKHLETIFERFESFARLSNPSPVPSTGIGLSLVRELVKMHHGRIEVESKEGVGSCFSVYFQMGMVHFQNDAYVDIQEEEIMREEPFSTEEFVLQGTEQEAGNRTIILIVEDNEELRSFLINALSPHYSVIAAADGEDGLLKVHSFMPDLILSDIMMPGIDGLEMAKRIKENVDICHIPVVLLSAKSSLGDRIKGLETGIDDYITKPFSVAYLKAKIVSILERRQQIKNYYGTLVSGSRRIDLIPEKPAIEPFDEQFLQKLMDLMEREMDNTGLMIEDLSEAVGVSRTVFYKKLKVLTGYAPIDFVRSIRIKRAMQLIEAGQLSVSEIAYRTGFNNPKYFSSMFKREYGLTPSEYRKQVKARETE